MTKKLWPIETGRIRALVPYLPAALVVLAAAVARCFIWLNTDVSWLLTLSEQALTDPHLYLHYDEINPPACFLIYLPAILLARVVPITPESIVTILVFAGVLFSLWMVGRILSTSSLALPSRRPVLLAVACAILLILPGDNFAEREHVTLIGILPLLAVYAKRAQRESVDVLLAAMAGIGGALAIAIKPHFALPIALPFAYAAWTLRHARTKLLAATFSPEHLALVLALSFYGLLIVALYPDYFHYTIPLALTIYEPMKTAPLLMAANVSILLTAASLLVSFAVGGTQIRGPHVRLCSLAALGFAAALTIQGKGWAYQGYPAIALSLLALALTVIGRQDSVALERAATGTSPRNLTMLSAIMFLAIYALASVWLLGEPDRSGLVRVVSRLVPLAHPKIISITGGPGIAFPLTRKLHGASLGHEPWQTVSAYAQTLLSSPDLDPVTRRRIEEYARVDRLQLAQTIRDRRPDAILFGGSALEAWAFSHPEISTELSRYREAAIVDGIAIWLPRICRPQPAPCGDRR